MHSVCPGPITPLTDLQYVVHAAALQQSDAPSERQPRLVAALPATSDLLPAGVERRVHADLPLAPRERPVNDPSLDWLRNPLETLLYPLKRPLLRDFPRRDVQEGLRALGFARFALVGRRAATRRPRGPLALSTRRIVARPTAEPFGWGLLYALRHDSSALTATEEVNAPYERGIGKGKGYPRLDCWPCMAKSSFYGNMGAGLLRACQTPLLTNEGEAGSARLARC